MPAAPHLVFLHGAGGISRGWDIQRLAFPAAVAPDLPGHEVRLPPPSPPSGATSHPRYQRIPDYAEWLRATGQAEGWFPAVLAGHSMGGAIALWYALEWPVDLAGIVLIATGARLRVSPEIVTALEGDYALAVDRIVKRALAPSDDRRLAERLRGAMLAIPPAVTAGDFQACDTFDVMGRLEQIGTPTLIITGRDDQMTPQRYAEYLHAHVRSSRLVSIPGAGHMVHMQRPLEVNEAIRQFMDEVAAPARNEHGKDRVRPSGNTSRDVERDRSGNGPGRVPP